MKLTAGLIGLLVVMPIWYYLLYKMLDAVNASELMWFLFWIYVPASVLSKALGELAVHESKSS